MPVVYHEAQKQPPWQSWTLIGVFFVLTLCLIAGSVQSWMHDGFSSTRANGWKNFWHGAPMASLATDLRKTPVAEWLGSRQRELGWLVLKDLGPRVKSGCDGWLFLGDEFTVHINGEHQAAQRLELAQKVIQTLSARGTQVVLAVVPDKTRVEAAQMCALRRPPALSERYAAWQAAGLQRHLMTLSLVAVLKDVQSRTGAAFDRTDTHWNVSGAQAVASAIADLMHGKGFVPSPERHFEVTWKPSEPRWGDLVRLAGLDELPPAWRPAPDNFAAPQFNLMPPTEQASSADALFGEQPATQRVALVGSSYSRNAHFADWLAAALHSEVGNLAKDGGGFSQSMTDFLQQEIKSESPTKWLIWEVPERVLQDPLGEGEEALLKQIQLLKGK